VISALYKNTTAAIKLENEASSWFRIKSGVKQSCVLSPLHADDLSSLDERVSKINELLGVLQVQGARLA